ncbi:hypothetical protein L202_08419 [Cryptococcus amylolentus CBS 6039]|uniref:Uncharacterized protein n=1 Tax=Cryptococcus amylolentus CBS 6039 TaxID=1295533 RepID=A0A1E3H9Q3_9TREE|nr:hypothetical protein L202_08419 [Cryptococcus amylolentus CBS 6039]ODN73024.1 hypothetical protein L202_08419 [Cryptococcus amylolentus CBS 6039]
MDYAQHQRNMLAHHVLSQMVPNTQQQAAPSTEPERYYLGGAYLRPSYPGMGLGPMYIGRYHPSIGYVPSNGGKEHAKLTLVDARCLIGVPEEVCMEALEWDIGGYHSQEFFLHAR